MSGHVTFRPCLGDLGGLCRGDAPRRPGGDADREHPSGERGVLLCTPVLSSATLVSPRWRRGRTRSNFGLWYQCRHRGALRRLQDSSGPSPSIADSLRSSFSPTGTARSRVTSSPAGTACRLLVGSSVPRCSPFAYRGSLPLPLVAFPSLGLLEKPLGQHLTAVFSHDEAVFGL